MKTIPIALAAHYEQPATTIACFLNIERSDDEVFGFTEVDVATTVAGDVYEPGLDVSELSISAGAEVDNLQISAVPDGPDDPALIDLLAGRWDGARFTLFECNWKAPADGVNVLRRGWIGNVSETRGGYSIELRGLKQAWQQAVGAVTSKTCRARLGDEACTVDLAPWTHDYEVTSVASRHVFTCTDADEADDYYGEGTATGVTGANAGFSQKVKTFAGGVFSLSLPMPFVITSGDTFRVVAGCRKRLLEDCRDKFDNVLNFQGEPHVPGADLLTADPDIGGEE